MLGVVGSGLFAADELDAGPDATGVLPTSARAADPFAEDGAGENEAALVFLQGASERLGLAGGPHEDADEGGEQVGGDGEAGTFGDVVDGGDEFDAASGSHKFF